MALDLHWVADDITATEAEGVEHIIDLWRSDQGLGQLVIDLPWVVDGVTPNEQIDLQGLAIIAYSDPPLAYQFFRSMEGPDVSTGRFTRLRIGICRPNWRGS